MAPSLKERIKSPESNAQILDGARFAYTLHKLNEYEYEILELTLHGDKIVDVRRSPASIREVVCNRLVTILQNGDSIESLS